MALFLPGGDHGKLTRRRRALCAHGHERDGHQGAIGSRTSLPSSTTGGFSSGHSGKSGFAPFAEVRSA